MLQLLNKKSGDLFDEDDVNILNIFASQSAAAIESARLYEAVREERDRVVAVEEDVRRRLARDLHDSLAQMLAAALMNVRFMNEEVSKQNAISTTDLSALEDVISKALFQVRTMLFDLRRSFWRRKDWRQRWRPIPSACARRGRDGCACL